MHENAKIEIDLRILRGSGAHAHPPQIIQKIMLKKTSGVLSTAVIKFRTKSSELQPKITNEVYSFIHMNSQAIFSN
eukprot:SAG11_NODE_1319_length_5209_cov_10.314873_1_plen_76_part_00